MFITYDKLENDIRWRFIRLNFDTGELQIEFVWPVWSLDFYCYWRDKGYTFIPYAEF